MPRFWIADDSAGMMGAKAMNTEGIFLCERIFGVAITNSEGKKVPVRYIGEQHVKEDLGRIPTAQDWLSQIKPTSWMYGQRFERDDSDLISVDT